MQKLHATQKASNLKVSRFSFVRVSLLAVAAISLSNISSVFASNLAITGANILSENSPAVRYSKGSHGSIVFSGDDDYCGADNVIGRGGTAGRGGKKITAEEEYRRFLEEVKFGNFSPYSQSDQKQTWTGNGHTSGNIGYMGALTGGDTNILPEAFGVYSFATGCGSAAQGSYSTAFGANATALTGGSQAFGVAALAAGKVSIAIGVGSETKGDSAVALGGLANAAGEISVAIGHKAQSTGKFAITMGDQAQATKEDSVAIGRMAKANALGSIALGAGSEVKVDGGVALGDSSVADTAAGIFGYEPRLKKASTSTDSAWQARRGAVSVGTLDRTRQITKVAAGTEYTDAVNVAQLKALQEYVDRSWKLSVDGKNARVVGIGDTVDFSAGSNNLNITKGEDDNNIKFDLAKDLTLNKVTAGANTFDDTGLIIKDGPKIVKDGIDVWNKKITNVADGTTKNDAVNFSQLQELKDLMSSKDALASWDGDRVRVGAPKNFSAKGSVVIGPLSDELELKVYPTVKAQYGIGIGMRAEVNSKSTWGVAVGYGARVNSVSGIALGAYSYSTFEAGRHGYDPRTGKESTSDNRVWKSSYGSLSIGGDYTSRQIINVAAGTDDYDAVNVAQLKALRSMIKKQGSWDLSVNDAEEKTAIGTGDTLALTAGSENLKIKNDKTENGSKVTFDLAKDLALNSIKLGEGTVPDGEKDAVSPITLDATGLIIANGPKIMATGIDAGSKKITNVADATDTTDAVNFGQLNKAKQEVQEQVEKQVAANSFVKQDTDTKHITIGKETDGDKIEITNKEGGARTLSGVKAGTEETDAVNFGQLKKIQTEVTEQVAANSFVKQDSNTKYITIGKETDGDKIDITNNANKARILSGVKAGTESTDAVNFAQLKESTRGWKIYAEGEFKEPTAEGVSSIAIGSGASASNVNAIALGTRSQATGNAGVALGAGSVAYDNGGIWGYDPLIDGESDSISYEWRSALGSISVGDHTNKYSRQITGVAAGSRDTDAVNVVQLKSLRNYVNKGWKLSVDGKNAKAVGIDDTVDFAAGSNNLTITKSESNNKVKFDLAKDLTLDSITVGSNTLNTTGLKIANGPQITTEGINAGEKIITAVANGKISQGSKDAINGSQLYTLGNNVAKSFGGDAGYENGSWKAPNFKVKTVNSDGKEDEQSYTSVAEAFEGVGTSFTNVQNKFSQEITNQINNAITNIQGESLIKKNKETNLITIGKEVAGGAIDIANKNGEARTLSGVKEAAKDNEAVNKAQLDTNIKKVEDKLAEAVGNITQQVQGDALLWSNTDNAFVADHKKNGEKTKSKITHLLDGDIASGSTDAVTGGQLYSMNEHLATYFGGGAGYDAQGNWQAPSFKVKTVKKDGNSEDKNYTNVADALAGVGTSFTNVQNKFTNEITNQINHLQSDDSAVVHYDKKDGTINYGSVTFGGKDKTPTSLHNVANGIISDKSHDAVTGGQIYKIGEDIAKFLGGSAAFNNGAFTGPTYKLSYITKDGVVTENSLDSVGTAIAGLDINIKNVNQRIKEVSEGVAQDSLSWSKEANAFSAQHGAGAKTNSKIKFLAAGDIAKDSTDAINGSQLYSMNNTLATYFGGGAEYKDGKWVAPSFKVKTVKKDSNEVEEIAYDNVADAFAGMSTSITDIHNEVNNQISNIVSDSLVKQDDTGLIKIGAEKEGGAIDIANKNGEARTLSGVKEAAKDNEAVNKAQLDTNIKKVEDKLAEAVGNITQQVQGDALLWSNTDNAFVADHKKNGEKTKSKITHLLDGDIASGSTDAVTGGQLYSMNEHLATYFGGGAGYDAQGNWQAPSFKVKTVKKDGNSEDKNYTNVADALAGVGTSFTNVQNKFTNEITNQINHLQSDDSAVVHYDKKDGTINYGSVTFGGKDKTPTSLHNVANGIISDKSHDAVTGGQIYKIGEDIAKFLGGSAAFNNGAFTGPTYKLSYITKDGVVTENSLDSVGTAIAGLDINIKNVNQRIKEVSEGVAQDSLSWSKEANAFSAQHGAGAKTNSKIKFLAAGDIAKDSTDAINGSQLYSMNNTLATYFGGGAEYKDGKWVAPSFKVKTVKKDSNEVEEIAYDNVADAFAGMSTSITDIHNEVNNQISNIVSDSLVKQDDTGLIKIGAEKEGGAIDIANKNGEARTLSGVKEAAKDNEAVNKAQLDTNIKKVEDKLAEAVGNITQQVQGDALLWSNTDNAFVADHKKNGEKTKSKITHLLDGDIASGSTDAVTGGQLYSMNEHLATYFGGGAGYDAQGNWQAPSFKVKTVKKDGNSEDKNYTNVADALAGVGTSFTNVQNKFTNEITNQINHLQSDDSAVVHYDKKDGTINYGSVTFGGKDKTPTSLHNVANGIISDKSHDAVTGGQIYKIGEDIAKFLGGSAAFNNGAFTGPTYKLSYITKDGVVTENSLDSVGTAIAGLDINIKNVNDRIKEVSEGVAQDSLSWSKEANAFSAQHGEKEKTNSKIKFLAAGDITKDSTDAINGSQLYSMNNTLATYFGGGAGYDKQGKWQAPNFKVKTVKEDGNSEDKNYTNVADALAGVGTSFTNVQNKFTTEITNQINRLQSDDSAVVHYDKKDGTINYGSVTFGGKDKTATALHNIADGNIAKDSHDAITGGQINTISQDVAKFLGGEASFNNGAFTQPTYKLSRVDSTGKITDSSFNDVGSAFAGLDKNIKNVNDRIKEVSEGVAQDSLSWSKEANAFSAQHGEKEKTNSKIKFLAAGDITKDSTDAINGSQLYSMNNTLATYFGGGAGYDKQGKWQAPNFKVKTVKEDGNSEDKNYTNVADALAGVGTSFTNVQNKFTTEITNQINRLQSDDSAVVHYDKKDGTINYGSVTFGGKDKTATALHNIADGNIAKDSHDAITGGQINTISQDVAKFLGGEASFNNGAFTQPTYKLSRVDSTGKITDSSFNDVGSAFAGLDINIKNVNQRIKEVSEGVAQDSLSWSKEANAFSAQHGEKEKTNSKIKFLAAGDITKDSTDAINGSQLYSMNNTLATYFGGGAEYKEGKWTAPNFKVNVVNANGDKVEEQSYDSVAKAFEGVGSSFTNLHNEVTNAVTNINNHINNVVSDSLVKQDEESKVIKIGAEKGGTSINIANSGDAARTLTGVKSGTLTETSTDAVNGSQLYSLNQTLASYFGGGAEYKEGKWTAPNFKVNVVNANGDKVEEKRYDSVAAAFEGVGNSFTNIHKELKNEINQVVGESLVKQDEKTHVIAVGGETNGTKVSFANSDGIERVLSGVKAGELSTKSTEAVNGSQLYSMSNTLATYFGGGAGYDEKGEWQAPSFKVNTVNADGKEKDETYQNVAEALAGVGTSFTNVHNKITNEINNAITKVEGDSLVKQAKETDPITIGKEVAGTEVNIANKDKEDRTLSGVKAAVNGNEAVNKAQLDQSLEKLSNSLQSDDSAVVHYDKKESGETDYTSVTLGKGKGSTPVGLHNVANGNIAKDSHDVVTGGQINTISQDVAKFLGGDTSFEKGSFTGPTYKLSEVDTHGQVSSTEFKDVGSAFAGLDKNIKNVNDRIKEVSEGVAQDSLSWSKEANAFSAQHGEGKDRTSSKITHILDGDITTNSSDAVNGSQLYSMNNTLASYFGGGAEYKEGKWVAPSFKVNVVNANGDKVEEQSYKTVAEAFAGVGSSFTNIHNEVTNAVTDINNHINNVVSDSLVKQDEESKVIKIGAEKGGSSINISNSGDAARTLTGVKSGGLTETSTDAVNGSQLYSMNNTLASYFGGGAEYKEGKWVAPSFKVNVVNANGDKVEEQSYKTVAEAFAGVGSSFTNIHNEVTNAVTDINNHINNVVSDSLVKQDEESKVIKIGAEKGGSSINISNSGDAARTLTGVKAGGLTETSTDAVNGSQLFATNQNVTAVTNDLKTVSENTSKFLGGGADVLKGIAPTYTVQDKSYQSVADAFGGVDRSFTALHEEIAKNTSDLSDTLKQNALLWSDKDHAFVAIHGTDADKKNSKITLLANGSITKDSTDAINGSQLYSMNNTLATYFGGGAEYKEGKWVAPSFKVNTVSADGGKVEEQSYDNVAAAFAGVGSSFTNLHNELKNEISQVVKDSLVKQDEESKVIKIGAEKEGTEITIANSDGAERSLSGVKAGTLSADSTEAVNGGQLYSLNQTLASYFGGGAEFENGQWVAPSFTILSFNEDGSSEETSYNSVSAAFAGVNRSFMKLHHELSDTVEQNALLWSDADESFVALHGKGSEKHNSKLSHLVDGDISAGSTEAITGNQLYQLNQTLAAYLGGGASYQGGEWTAPHFEVKQFKSDGSSSESKSYDNVAGAFEGVNGSLSGINDRLNDVSKNVSTNSLKWNDELEGYDGRHNGSDSKITHVADGDVSEGSKEVVNGGQLWETNQKVSAVENRVESLDQHVKDVESAVTNGAVNYDKDDAGHKTNKVTLVGGDDSAPVLIDNLAEGRIESGSKEAVTGGQLHDYTDKQMKLVLEDAKKYTDEHVTDIVNNGVSESKAYTDMKFETLNYAIEDVRKEARQAAAIGLAVSNLRYYDIPGSLSVSFGSGLWRSQSAFAIGAGYTSEDGNIRSNVSITSAGGHWGIGAGITLRLR
ncbi:Vomp family autotransporter [Bartonella krasnovii]|uniref:Vomp family autotransporter n=1 Tax=Bartonella krasnovii TaxID=2267275 RepID=UPI001F4C65B7|nr:Vomp family autotransporter [Bartonella krasnovii]UNF45564.1 Vomp family autotransporter [Bartonella krasnovii]